jgi:flavin reductase (DIM6/NTAB) family NADH-FMN oxidoreductase RutF
VTVVTVLDAAGRAHGMTVSAFSSVSMTPPLVLVCIDRDATMLPMLGLSQAFGINFLADDQAALSQRFADSALETRFDGLDWAAGPGGAPWLARAHANLTCTVVQRIAAGDHEVIIGLVAHGRFEEGSRPLVYHRGTYASVR